MPEAQSIKIQHGCGCLSGCATIFGLLVLVGPAAPLLDWALAHSGLTLALVFAAAIALGIAKSQTGKAPTPTAAAVSLPGSAADKLCPDCGETVKAAARVCRFCRHEF